MASFKNRLIILFLVSFAFPYFGSSQIDSTGEVNYDINRVLPYISITKEQLKDVRTLSDIDPQFKSSWVKEYVSVEILTSYQGTVKKAMSKDSILSQEQIDLMKMSKTGSDISARIQYIPDNNLKHNDVKEFHFSFTFDPENNASFTDGKEQLKQYLKEKAIDKIPADSFENYNLAAIKFTVTEEGEITNVHVFDSAYQGFKNEYINSLLIETVQNMPCWKPAEYSDGTKVKQDFILAAGDMRSCFVNLLNIRKLAIEE